MLGPDRPFDAPLDLPDRRRLLLVAGLVVLLLAALFLARELPHTLFPVRPKLVPDLWPSPPEALVSYEFRGTTPHGEVRQWALAPNKWRSELGTQRIYVANDIAVWDFHEHLGVYYGFPYESAKDLPGAPPAPIHQDGRTFYRTQSALASTRAYLGTTPLGPINPEQLMGELEHASEWGTWSIREGELLGRKVQVIEIEVKRRPKDSHTGPYSKTIWLDPQYMFVLAIRHSGIGPGDYEARITDLKYNEPIPEAVFVFEPPAGAKNCLPPQFAIPPDCRRGPR